MVFCGIELHSNNSFVVVSDENDKVLFSRRLPNDLSQICDALSPYRAQLSGVVIEFTINWTWLVDGLMETGYTVHLANTTAIKQVDGLKHRGDESDARHLAHTLRLGLLPEGHIMPKPGRAIPDLELCPGRMSRRRTLGFAIASKHASFISAKRASATMWWRLRRWPANWHGLLPYVENR